MRLVEQADNILADSILAEHASKCRDIVEAVGDPELQSELLRDVRNVVGVIGSYLQMTIKTHRPYGEVVP